MRWQSPWKRTPYDFDLALKWRWRTRVPGPFQAEHGRHYLGCGNGMPQYRNQSDRGKHRMKASALIIIATLAMLLSGCETDPNYHIIVRGQVTTNNGVTVQCI